MVKNPPPKVIAILADLPLWTLPGLEYLGVPSGHYATWLEPLISEFEGMKDLDIHWITLSKRVASHEEHLIFGQTIHVLPRGRKSVSMMTGYLRESMAIQNVIRKIQPSLVHAWGSEDVYGLAGAFSPVDNRLFTLQGCLSEYLRLLGGGWLFRLQALYEKPTIRRYAFGTAESPTAKNLMQAIRPTMDIRLVDYGVHPAFFETAWNPAPDPVVVFLGGVSKRKGIIDLIAVAKLPELAHVKFKIIGAGDMAASLMAQSSPNVEWLGKCDREKVIPHLARAWCLAIPTYSDTGPTVVKEARVIGLPVITTNAAGASCYIEDGRSGFVTNPGDQDALANSITRLCETRDGCIAMGRHGWQELRGQLHPSTTAAKFEAIYHRMISGT